ncbi:MAG: GAF domain-containing protein, partial [Bacteroidota bacterium]
NDELVGMLEIGSPNIGDLDTYSISKLQQVMPLFSMAVKRKIEDLSTEVEVIKQKEFTAIHPTVAWRFNQAAYNLKLKKDTGMDEVMESIVFEDVYPLYGQLDIRGSSRERNKSIKQDLQHQLQLAGKIISSIYEVQPLPILDELSYRVQKNLDDIKEGVNAGDEVNILDFIRNEIEVLVAEFEGTDERINQACALYKEALDTDLGIIYNHRKDFEQSLTKINEKVSLFLDQKEAEAQKMFPHYFEKYKTDGVEFNIYVGDSLTRDRVYSPIYLENLRLWQLETIAEATILTEKLRHKLPVPLQTTQLILVQGSPLSIRFRQDEKQFDVDGAYNIRYEIVKKRIDKAMIKGTDERLT